MKSLKKNQIIIYTFALMLVAAGYLNYTSKIGEEATETASKETYVSELETADIGDAKLVNSNDIVTEEETHENNTNEKSNSESQENTNTINQNTSVQEKTKEETNKENLLQTSAATNKNSDDYFVKSKLERDTMYSQMIETYENILNSSNSLETRKAISYTRNY